MLEKQNHRHPQYDGERDGVKDLKRVRVANAGWHLLWLWLAHVYGLRLLTIVARYGELKSISRLGGNSTHVISIERQVRRFVDVLVIN